MDDYRIYPLAESGRIAGPPRELRASDDAEIRQIATEIADVRRVEIWAAARLVARLDTLPKAGGDLLDSPVGPRARV